MKKSKKFLSFVLILIVIPVYLIWADGGYFSKAESVAVSADQRAIIIKNGNDISITFSTGYTGEGERLPGYFLYRSLRK